MDKNFKHFSNEYSYKIQELCDNLIERTAQSGDTIFKKNFTSDLLEEFIYENIRYKKKHISENNIKDYDIIKK